MGLQQPTNKAPLHIKAVAPLNRTALEALPVVDKNLYLQWQRVRKWLTGDHPPVHGGEEAQARITATELELLLEAKLVERTERAQVKATCILFPVPEPNKGRRRLIRHTKCINDHFGKDSLEGITLTTTSQVVMSAHQGRFAITFDFAAYFDQHLLEEKERVYHGFPHGSEWYRLCRLPMGQRQAVDVAHTATCLLTSFELPPGVTATAYIDDVRFLGQDQNSVLKAARTFINRCREANVTINDVPNHITDEQILSRIRTQGEFLGVDINYEQRRVRLATKSQAKLAAAYEAFQHKGFTYRNCLALYGMLFFVLQVTRESAAKYYYCLKEYSSVARQIQSEPDKLDTTYTCPPERARYLSQWVEEALKNPWTNVRTPLEQTDGDDAHILITDASSWGWGALLRRRGTSRWETASGRWADAWLGAKTSAWAEPEAVARAVAHFFPTKPEAPLIILTDSRVASDALEKGRSGAFAVNKAVTSVFTMVDRHLVHVKHIAGTSNPADGLSRGVTTGPNINIATQQALGITAGLFPSQRTAQ
jgi:hypothetical protein